MSSTPSEELTLVVTGHGVSDYPAWLQVFQGVAEDADVNPETNIHATMEQKLSLAGKQINPKQDTDGKDCCIVVALASSAKYEAFKELIKYEEEPFETFKKDGTMIPPFAPNVVGRLVLDRWDEPQEKVEAEIKANPEEFGIYATSHGVPSWDEWYTQGYANGGPMPTEFRESLGSVRTLAAKGPVRPSDNKETVIVVHVFRKAALDSFQQFAKFEAPPFVGGADFIANGLVIPPFDINVFAELAYSKNYK